MACVLYIRDTVLAVRQVGNGPSERQRLACFRAFVHGSRCLNPHKDESAMSRYLWRLPTTRIMRIALGTSLCARRWTIRGFPPPPCGRDTGVAGVVRFARQAKPVCAQRIAQKRLSSGSFDRISGQSSLSRARSRVQGSHARSIPPSLSGPPRVLRAVSKAKVGTAAARPWPSPPATSALRRLSRRGPLYFPTGRWWVDVQ